MSAGDGPTVETHTIRLERHPGQSLGIDADFTDKESLLVQNVKSDSEPEALIPKWNAQLHECGMYE